MNNAMRGLGMLALGAMAGAGCDAGAQGILDERAACYDKADKDGQMCFDTAGDVVERDLCAGNVYAMRAACASGVNEVIILRFEIGEIRALTPEELAEMERDVPYVDEADSVDTTDEDSVAPEYEVVE